ncbi:mannitol dehydrogenase family protein [Streptomonospora wellingtoniae]|uniref:Mannitol dehydrogenase family protein n=1 Tax=Streptomonospora wellingtoniae TaxID=3075544 RepID=A0ABU2KNA6_9ACTN|nr:mannitol dehydrogenase family protein [Streptomonospora sp. DSM 45055]MDT0300752.1 mannitol dehydrogenase family protein [Streptomonospora sp. DSM 45055]
MTTATPRLSRAARGRLPAALTAELPSPGIATGIVHLGPGAFHRAHQAVFTQLAMAAEPGDWGICAAASRGRSTVEALRAQDHLYTVTERAADGVDRIRAVGAITDTVAAREEPERLAAAIAAPGTRVVTLTVTEGGYRHDPATGRLAPDDPETAADALGRAPRTAVGQLVRGLQARSRAGAEPLTVLPCDNLPRNGRLLGGLVESFCELLPESEAAPLLEWVHERVAFCSTVVDQVVPATAQADLDRVADELGVADAAAVVGEQYRSWVIEDRFAGPRPAWERVGAQFVGDVGPPEAVKLRCINATLTATACLGLLLGAETVAEAVNRLDLRRYLRALYRDEQAPSAVAAGGSPPEFDALLTRLGNPNLSHRLAQIAQQGIGKLPQRLVAPAAEHVRRGEDPHLACLAIAAWVHLLRVPAGARPQLDPVSEELAAELAPARYATEAVDLLRDRLHGLSEESGSRPDVGDRVAEALRALEVRGVHTAVQEAAG